MKIDELQEWILSTEGLAADIERLACISAAVSVGIESLKLVENLKTRPIDWERLILAASILARAGNGRASDTALLIAHGGLILSERPTVKDACAIILAQLSNERAVRLAESRSLIHVDLSSRIGVAEQLLSARRELNHSIFLEKTETIKTNIFQREFWDGLERAAWISASAPTASGKTFLVLQWLIKEFSVGRARLAVFIAPTRALVSEIEREIIELVSAQGAGNIRVSSLPLMALGDGSRPTILVFTQERLHIFLNSQTAPLEIDIAIVDEAQKLGDGLRGVILQDAVERISRSSPSLKVVFLSPLTENPEILVEDAPAGANTAVVPGNNSTVTQNLFVAEQLPRNSQGWCLRLHRDGESVVVGNFRLHSRPDSVRKRLSFIALAVGRHQTGTLVYANGADEAEKLAWQIFDGLSEAISAEIHPELKELSDFARDIIHPDFQLVDLLKRGVAFHYGNMPSLLRSEVERLFTQGIIRFLVCTSTLIEGVNLACRTIIVRGPRKGNGKPMAPHDFWNLAGRAGRWGKDFHGNIVCVDTNRTDAWPNGTPSRARYPIKRETEKILADEVALLKYLGSRAELDTSAIDPRMEQVIAYLLSWHMRLGSFAASPSATKLSKEYVEAIDNNLAALLERVDIPENIAVRHPGVSVVALQSLLSYFRKYRGPVENLLPSTPESDDAYDQFRIIFDRIDRYLFPTFMYALELHALVTVEWMRGFPLGKIIRNRISYMVRHHRPYEVAKIIRDTMREVEEFARFRVPKYLAAYLDVLKFYMTESGQESLFPDNLKFELYLEYGVGTKTLLSLIGIGLSRTSAIEINEFLASDDLEESEVIERLRSKRWITLGIPAIVKREIERVIDRTSVAAA